jgi:pimeloyl-ACP methyl ester carboxylesterase
MAERRGSSESYNFPRTMRVSHLGGIEASYRMAGPYKQYKPTLIMINSFTTCSDLYGSQLAKAELASAMNLIAIEPLGHGNTKLRSPSAETFTYWDTAYMVLQVMDGIGVKKAFALGTSQGGWIVTRLALIAPDRVRTVLTSLSWLSTSRLLTKRPRSPASSRSAHAWTTKANASANSAVGTHAKH